MLRKGDPFLQDDLVQLAALQQNNVKLVKVARERVLRAVVAQDGADFLSILEKLSPQSV